jgi:hypothetical protein
MHYNPAFIILETRPSARTAQRVANGIAKSNMIFPFIYRHRNGKAWIRSQPKWD